jgi:hypothetical protein
MDDVLPRLLRESFIPRRMKLGEPYRPTARYLDVPSITPATTFCRREFAHGIPLAVKWGHTVNHHMGKATFSIIGAVRYNPEMYKLPPATTVLQLNYKTAIDYTCELARITVDFRKLGGCFKEGDQSIETLPKDAVHVAYACVMTGMQSVCIDASKLQINHDKQSFYVKHASPDDEGALDTNEDGFLYISSPEKDENGNPLWLVKIGGEVLNLLHEASKRTWSFLEGKHAD